MYRRTNLLIFTRVTNFDSLLQVGTTESGYTNALFHKSMYSVQYFPCISVIEYIIKFPGSGHKV